MPGVVLGMGTYWLAMTAEAQKKKARHIMRGWLVIKIVMEIDYTLQTG